MVNKDLEYYLSLPYTITLKRGTGDGKEYWIAGVLELPHCMTRGATPEEALRDIEDAKREWLKSNLEAGLPIPEPAKRSEKVRLKMKKLGITEKDVEEAIAWARKSVKSEK